MKNALCACAISGSVLLATVASAQFEDAIDRSQTTVGVLLTTQPDPGEATSQAVMAEIEATLALIECRTTGRLNAQGQVSLAHLAARLDEAQADDLVGLLGRYLADVAAQRSAGASRAALLASQNPDGGWAFTPGRASNALDTALVVDALLLDPSLGLGEAIAADVAGYLVGSTVEEGNDSVWRLTDDESASDVVHTGLVTAAMQRIFVDVESVSVRRTIARAAGGLVGATLDAGASPAEYAVLLRALAVTQRVNSAGGPLLNHLQSEELPAGGWARIDGGTEAELYATAAALRALNQLSVDATELPDLLPVSFEATSGGYMAGLANDGLAPATKNGTQAVRMFAVYDGDPRDGGVEIYPGDGTVLTLASGQIDEFPLLSPGVELGTMWDLIGQVSSVPHVVVDPDGLVLESDETNNIMALGGPTNPTIQEFRLTRSPRAFYVAVDVPPGFAGDLVLEVDMYSGGNCGGSLVAQFSEIYASPTVVDGVFLIQQDLEDFPVFESASASLSSSGVGLCADLPNQGHSEIWLHAMRIDGSPFVDFGGARVVEVDVVVDGGAAGDVTLSGDLDPADPPEPSSSQSVTTGTQSLLFSDVHFVEDQMGVALIATATPGGDSITLAFTKPEFEIDARSIGGVPQYVNVAESTSASDPPEFNLDMRQQGVAELAATVRNTDGVFYGGEPQAIEVRFEWARDEGACNCVDTSMCTRELIGTVQVGDAFTRSRREVVASIPWIPPSDVGGVAVTDFDACLIVSLYVDGVLESVDVRPMHIVFDDVQVEFASTSDRLCPGQSGPPACVNRLGRPILKVDDDGGRLVQAWITPSDVEPGIDPDAFTAYAWEQLEQLEGGTASQVAFEMDLDGYSSSTEATYYLELYRVQPDGELLYEGFRSGHFDVCAVDPIGSVALFPRPGQPMLIEPGGLTAPLFQMHINADFSESVTIDSVVYELYKGQPYRPGVEMGDPYVPDRTSPGFTLSAGTASPYAIPVPGFDASMLEGAPASFGPGAYAIKATLKYSACGEPELWERVGYGTFSVGTQDMALFIDRITVTPGGEQDPLPARDGESVHVEIIVKEGNPG